MKCLQCNTNEAIKDKKYGILPCSTCQNKYKLALENIEITTDDIKTQRKSGKDQMIQPFRNGIVSKEYLDKYGSKYIKVTDQEVKTAKNVWPESQYY